MFIPHTFQLGVKSLLLLAGSACLAVPPTSANEASAAAGGGPVLAQERLTAPLTFRLDLDPAEALALADQNLEVWALPPAQGPEAQDPPHAHKLGEIQYRHGVETYTLPIDPATKGDEGFQVTHSGRAVSGVTFLWHRPSEDGDLASLATVSSSSSPATKAPSAATLQPEPPDPRDQTITHLLAMASDQTAFVEAQNNLLVELAARLERDRAHSATLTAARDKAEQDLAALTGLAYRQQALIESQANLLKELTTQRVGEPGGLAPSLAMAQHAANPPAPLLVDASTQTQPVLYLPARPPQATPALLPPPSGQAPFMLPPGPLWAPMSFGMAPSSNLILQPGTAIPALDLPWWPAPF